jgi:hypothetical protein
MWRSIVIAALVYGYGHPKYDGYRPAGLDAAMQGFYLEVNKVAEGSRQVFGRFDNETTLRYVKNSVDNVGAELKPSAETNANPAPAR